jgi:methylenetetrahydrofolate reductase (NADPH)
MNRTKKRPPRLRAKIAYKIYCLAHNVMFNYDGILVKMLRPLARFIDKRRRLKNGWDFFEGMAKGCLFGCMSCGDCGLPEVAYVCPMSQCPKNQRNGPCGGAINDWCEGYPNERKCVWVRAYERLDSGKDVDEIRSRIILPQDWRLWRSPSWLNFILGKDHNAKKTWIEIKK